MAEPKPKLVAVESAPSKGASDRAPQPRRRWTDLGVGIWLLAVFVVVTVMIISAQKSQLDRLSAQVVTLETELSTAHGALRGYESRFGEIRESVGSLRAQLGELEGLVEQSPAPGTAR